MRKFVCVLIAVMMCAMLALPVMAATDPFVPSIGYKDGPSVVEGPDCIVVSSLKEAKDKTTDISQEDRDLLWDVYNKLSDGTVELEIDSDKYVVRELVDISFKYEACRQAGHTHEQDLKQAGNTVELTLSMGLSKGTDLKVFVYLDGKWTPVEKVTVNSNGTVTCVFEDICPVAFAVPADAIKETPKTGDMAGNNMILWIVLMVTSFSAAVVLLINRRKFVR